MVDLPGLDIRDSWCGVGAYSTACEQICRAVLVGVEAFEQEIGEGWRQIASAFQDLEQTSENGLK